jgi:hypothetical protein
MVPRKSKSIEDQASFRNNMAASNSLMRFIQHVKQGFNQKKAPLQCP